MMNDGVTYRLRCTDCGASLGTVSASSYDDPTPVRLGEDNRIYFTSWEVGATVTPRCDDCTDGEVRRDG